MTDKSKAAWVLPLKQGKPNSRLFERSQTLDSEGLTQKELSTQALALANPS